MYSKPVDFCVSVIIPIYNAEKYLRKAVESAVRLKEVGEVILIEDGSPDNAFLVCKELQDEYDKIKIYRHPRGENKGAGASRNLGMEKASNDIIAFLDADDWYLPNRFKAAEKIFGWDKVVDGVYEPVGAFFYNPEDILFGKKRSKEEGDKIITFLKNPVKSDELFYSLLSQKNGTICTNGITLKKSFVQKVGLFSEELKLHQDSEYWLRCAYYGKLVAPESPEIIAVRGVHGENRVRKVEFRSRALYYENLFNFYRNKELKWMEKILLYKNTIVFDRNRKHQDSFFLLKYYELLKITLNFLFHRFPTKRRLRILS